MVPKVAALALLCGLIVSQVSPAAAQNARAQATPAASVTAGFTSFLTDVLAGRVPENIPDQMKSQYEALGQVKTALAPLGAFHKLEFEREDSMQGYHRYHYTAVFAKGTRKVVFVTDSNGLVVGFFPDQQPREPSGAPTPPP